MATQTVFTLLGTGSSGGVPRVGNQWGACDPANPRNRRRRCALLLEARESADLCTSVLVDTGADMREQMLSANVLSLDAVLLTHSHADHIFGLDDLRQMAFSLGRSIDVHMDSATSQIVMQSFGYCFHQKPGSNYPVFCAEQRIQHDQPITMQGPAGVIKAEPIVAEHGDIDALGFRFDDVVYLPDVKRVTNKNSLNLLRDTRVLIIDSLRHKSHPAHMSVEESLEFINTVNPQRAILTNMHSDLDYDTLQRSLPDRVEPGYDGLQFS